MESRDEYFKQNRALWDEITPVHAASEFYDMKGFESGKNTLSSIELNEVGEVSGKSLLHLLCHFGMDALSWARLGAKATGVDFSDKAITLARLLSQKINTDAKFICSNIYNMPPEVSSYDIVFTSQGVLCWLSDLTRWAQIIADHLKKGAFFYIFEMHPFCNMLDYNSSLKNLEFQYSYFSSQDPTEWPPNIDYADKNTKPSTGTFEWTHPLSEIVSALINSGLQIEFVHEFPVLFFQANPLLTRDADGWWRMKGDKLPLSFSIKARKPA